jgi:16S rRNA (cytosine1402-N4)-methyltransferase
MSDARHVPVLKDQTIELLRPASGRRIVDGTFGFGGHSRALLDSGAEVLGLDLDGVAIESCQRLAQGNPGLQCQRISFRYLERALKTCGWDGADGVLLDLGVSSWQLDDPAKGFSYRADGPLDLRFNQDSGQSAADLLHQLEETELANLIWELGEERGSRRIARALVIARQEEPITTTTRLRQVVQGVVPRGLKIQPVLSRIFQALRIAVNEELPSLEEALAQLPGLLRPGGRFVVISYHSLEDRRVKQFIDRERRDCLCPTTLPTCVCGHKKTLKPLTKKAVQATKEEQRTNPRSRSAKLRAAEVI